MAELPRGLLDSLNGDVSSLADNARGAFERRFSAMLPGFLDEGGLVPPDRVADLRDAAIGLMDEVAGAAAEASCARGAMFYDEARTACAGKALGHSPSPHRRVEHDDDAIRGMVDSVDGTGDPSAFAEACAQRVDYSVRRACGDAVADCGRADPLKPKFARVPAGAETCGFCLMLAGRGAVYANELTAGAADHYHANCDCKIVPDFGEGIEGYDQEGMSRRYGLCLDAIGGLDGVRCEWDLLPKDKREACIAKHGGKTGKAFEEFLAERVSAEIVRRDPKWFMTGKAPDTDYSIVPRDEFGHVINKSDGFNSEDYDSDNIGKKGREWRDLFIHDALRESGMKVKPRPANAPDGYSNIDAEIDGKLYEFKSPEEPKEKPKPDRELAFIESNLRGAKKQFGNQFDESTGGRLQYDGPIRVVLSLRYRDVDLEAAINETVRRMRQHSIDEVIILSGSGRVIRLKL